MDKVFVEARFFFFCILSCAHMIDALMLFNGSSMRVFCGLPLTEQEFGERNGVRGIRDGYNSQNYAEYILFRTPELLLLRI